MAASSTAHMPTVAPGPFNCFILPLPLPLFRNRTFRPGLKLPRNSHIHILPCFFTFLSYDKNLANVAIDIPNSFFIGKIRFIVLGSFLSHRDKSATVSTSLPGNASIMRVKLSLYASFSLGILPAPFFFPSTTSAARSQILS